MKRKRSSKNVKARVALEAIKGQKTANELASEYEVHVTLINTWKKLALEGLPEVFGQGRQREEEAAEVETDRRYRQIGRLQVEVDWLKRDRTSRLSVEERRRCIEAAHPGLSIARQRELIGLSRPSDYRGEPDAGEDAKNLGRHGAADARSDRRAHRTAADGPGPRTTRLGG